MYNVERGLFDLRQGRPVYIVAPDRSGALIASVDGLEGTALKTLRGVGALWLTVTSHRAKSMGLSVLVDKNTKGLSLGLNGEGPEQIFKLASASGVDGTKHDAHPATDAEFAGLRLARLGRLLPAVVGAPVNYAHSESITDTLNRAGTLSVTTAQVDEMVAETGVRITHVSEGVVPLAHAAEARFVAFRETSGLLEHVAVLIGSESEWPDPVPVRIHSACLTGDLFGSLRCDCGEQLRGSLRLFEERGGGVLLYMSQEGRDIGLGNKLRAYALQEQGLDTIDADGTLGFGADERNYGAAVEMLKNLGVKRVELITNNPDKVRAVKDAGIEIVERRPMYGTLNRHNLPYVRAKAERAGHWLEDMLAGSKQDR